LKKKTKILSRKALERMATLNIVEQSGRGEGKQDQTSNSIITKEEKEMRFEHFSISRLSKQKPIITPYQL